MTKDHTTATGPPSTPSRTSRFLACFGCYGDKTQQPIHKVNSSSRRRRWIIPKWSFGSKKPVNVAPVKPDTTWEIQVVEQDTTLTKKHVTSSKEVKTGRKKWTDLVKSMKPPGTGVDSPKKRAVAIANPFVSTPLKPLTHSKSLPPPKRQKPPKPLTSRGGGDSKSLSPPKQKPQKPLPPAGGGGDGGVVRETTPSGGEFDSIYAMSILLVIMVIMVLWGKLCAIFCTCAWFLVAPRLVAPGGGLEKQPPGSEKNLNLESVEYKKKVVLEGLLQRNHRSVVAG